MDETKNQYKPDTVSAPGETLGEILVERGISQEQLSERTGISNEVMNGIISGKVAITPETALQLERVLGTPASFWTVREQNYRESLSKEK
jgi:addiction module HigA family antidote